MKVKLLYFAGLKEITRKPEEVVSFKGETTEDLKNHLKALYPSAADLIEVSRFAVNGRYYEGKLKEGDEVALIPPVSGG